jgi:hypothetical protein
MPSCQNAQLTSYKVDQMAKCHYLKLSKAELTKWQVVKIANGPNGMLTKWQK